MSREYSAAKSQYAFPSRCFDTGHAMIASRKISS